MRQLSMWTRILYGHGSYPPRSHVDQVEDEAGEEDRGEEAGQDADRERDGEALHGSRPELVEDGRRDEHGDVGVDDRSEGAGEPRVDGGAHRLPGPELFPDALEDEDV